MPRRTRIRILLPVALILLSTHAHPGEWSQIADMNVPRQYPGLALLPGGRILAVTGHPLGDIMQSLDSAEIYDIEKDEWRMTDSLAVPRNGVEPEGLMLLPNGKAMIIGGGSGSRSVHEVELFDPETETWSETASMSVPRCVHSSVMLDDGRVLVTGGIDWTTNDVHASAEIYDHRTETWSPAGTMKHPRWNHRSVKLDDGRVLVVGGAALPSGEEGVLASAEIFDPKSNKWIEAAPMTVERRAPGLVLLQDGRAMVIGGKRAPGTRSRELASVEIFDPVSETWTLAAPLKDARWGPTATRLTNGKILVTGGMYGRMGRRNSVELYDPATNTWTPEPELHTRRNGHRAITLPTGQVLIVGGYNALNYLPSSELYTPDP